MILAKRFILNVWQGSEYTSAVYTSIVLDIYQLEVVAREIFIIEKL